MCKTKDFPATYSSEGVSQTCNVGAVVSPGWEWSDEDVMAVNNWNSLVVSVVPPRPAV